MKLGLTTKEYPNHGAIVVPCDEHGNAMGDNIISIEIVDGITTVKYHADESITFGNAKNMRIGRYYYSASSAPREAKQAISNSKMVVTVDTTELKVLLKSFQRIISDLHLE